MPGTRQGSAGSKLDFPGRDLNLPAPDLTPYQSSREQHLSPTCQARGKDQRVHARFSRERPGSPCARPDSVPVESRAAFIPHVPGTRQASDHGVVSNSRVRPVFSPYKLPRGQPAPLTGYPERRRLPIGISGLVHRRGPTVYNGVNQFIPVIFGLRARHEASFGPRGCLVFPCQTCIFPVQASSRAARPPYRLP